MPMFLYIAVVSLFLPERLLTILIKKQHKFMAYDRVLVP